MIVPSNLRDFSDTELAQVGIGALRPDEYVMDLFTLDGARVHRASSAAAAAWRNLPGAPADVCDRLAAVVDDSSLHHLAQQARPRATITQIVDRENVS